MPASVPVPVPMPVSVSVSVSVSVPCVRDDECMRHAPPQTNTEKQNQMQFVTTVFIRLCVSVCVRVLACMY